MLPQVLGHAFGGEVEAVGAGVAKLAPGGRVAVQPSIMPRGGEYFADRGWHHLSGSPALAGHSRVSGGMAEMALLNDDNIGTIPGAMTDEAAALVVPAAVCVQACDRGRIAARNSVLVTGAGLIGILARPSARAFGATRPFVSDVNDARLKPAAEVVPGVVTINPARQDVGEAVRAGRSGLRCGAGMRRQRTRAAILP